MSSNILHLIDHMGLGGAQRVICGVLELQNHECHSLRTTNNSVESGYNYSITDRKSAFNVKCLLDTYVKVKELDIEYIHCHMPISKIVGLLMKICPLANVKLVFHEHGTIYRKNIFYREFIRFANNWVSKHISVSERGQELLVEAGVENDKIDIIRNYAELDRFSESKLRQFNLENEIGDLDDTSYKLGYAGRIVEWKGWKDFIESSYDLENTEFLIAGDGKEVEDLKEKIGSNNQIFYLGFIDDIRQLFEEIDCLVIPSHWDPNPLIFYEGLAAGVPVIASRCNSVKEITEDRNNCLEFTPGDPDDLAQKIREIRDNKELEEKLVKNGKLFAEKNDKSRFLDEFRSFYQRLEN